MEILCVDPARPQPAVIARAAACARSAAPVAFPTDTVYGVGVAVVPAASPEPLFALKNRNRNKAIPWLVAGIQALDEYGDKVPSYAFDLACAHWPGALTLIVRASAAAPRSFVAADGTLALRAPAHPVPLALMEALGAPLATTSANLQGDEPAISVATLAPRLVEGLALALDGGPAPGGAPSTIVSCLTFEPHIVREGALDSALLLH